MSNLFQKSVGIKDVKFGHNVTIINPVNLYGCEIGNDVFIGPFVEVQKRASVGSGTRIQSHSFICELTIIGKDCFIGHGVMFINDPFSISGPARGDESLWRPVTMGDRVSIGSNATILPVHICSDVVIGAGSVVTKNIEEPGVYAGNPAIMIRQLNRTDQSVLR